jgi:hypothetical protein
MRLCVLALAPRRDHEDQRRGVRSLSSRPMGQRALMIRAKALEKSTDTVRLLVHFVPLA